MVHPGNSSTISGVREPDHLRAFVRESNRIEGITRAPTKGEMEAHRVFLALEDVTVDDVCRFVLQVARRTLRNQPGMDVRVGSHIAPPGGPEIVAALASILARVSLHENGYRVHLDYETLHPFMDGNGRSGRVLWLWQMLRGQDPWALRRGFLHSFYYQTLSAIPCRFQDGSTEPLGIPGRNS